MSLESESPFDCCPPQSRRTFLADLGMGFTGAVLGSMLAEEGILKAADAESSTSAQHHHPPRAKSLIWIFLSGGYSHL
jgi:hypothetical protein